MSPDGFPGKLWLRLAQLLLWGVLFTWAKPITAQIALEQLLAAPFVSELVAAPAEGRLAWVTTIAGIRNIWTAEPPAFEARRITNYTTDEGLELSELTWMPDGQRLLFVRGSHEGRERGSYPNPLHLPQGTSQEIWLLSTQTGELVRIAEGHSPEPSPDGRSIAFLRHGEVWLATLETPPKIHLLFRTKGRCHTLRWSPDGSALAFVSDRQTHSFVGIFRLADSTITYLSPSTDFDVYPSWSNDGRYLAFIRIPSTSEWLSFGTKRAGPPWSIWLAESRTGQARTLWQADHGPGSVFRPVTARDQLLWGADHTLVFPWEKDGWLHLYALSLSNPSARLLTPGNSEIEHVWLSYDKRFVLFSSNEADIDRRHIWRVALPNGTPTQLTSGASIEWSPVMTNDGTAVAFLRSDSRRPSRVVVRQEFTGQQRELQPELLPPEFPAEALVEPQPVEFPATDGMKIRGQLFLPPGIQPEEKRPAVIFLHGGSRRQMLLGWHYMHYYHLAYAFNQYLASRGFVILSVNYRSGTGYGLEFREALNYGATGASELNDVIGAALYLQQLPQVDPTRIALWGGSYGGYLTAMGLAKAPHLFKAGVDIHGVHDWRTETRLLPPAEDPFKKQELEELAFNSSPLAYVDSWKAPVLLIHGDDDRNVEFQQTVKLVEALRKRNIEFEVLVFPDEVHDFLVHSHWVEAYRRAAEFLERHLGWPASGRKSVSSFQ